MADLIGAAAAIGNLILRFIIVFLALLVRRELKKRAPQHILRFYDLLIISFAIYAISKLFFLPLNLDRAGLIEVDEKTARILNSIANFLINIFGIILVYAWIKLFRSLIQKYRIIPIVQPLPGKLAKIIPSGVYITEQKRFYEKCKTLLQGRKAIIITRQKPEDLKSKLGVEVPVIWLAKVEVPDAIHPHNLERFAHELISFMRSEKGPKSIIIDGFEYLMIENGFESVFKFLTSLKDYSTLTDTVTVIPVKREALEEKQYALLLREFPKLEEIEVVQKE
ncbi:MULTISPECIES: DUF835 domain-containing protein [Thermococcus]|uniref:DUF835 domain-containing protein n=2 Tax=Thermococcus sibiricus TaxID=172049 RepID=C6A1G9_THESM|nr:MULTISPECIES: DUF835 domain-containing protein [Thermococcus]KUK28947.1 MAG: Uncharacterized protein XD61_0506 [Thermococcus sp. 40_45]HII67164.1 DUF835 domain-containing protein [Thermococcaceae archaeon]ACS89464.1 hypothetical protein TSIB_0398 [Thermococcus sibiricus MM 739]KUK17664.1 MAG: Uncharacterized protein XD54_1029 [Thermococcus sibiricus]MBC7094686.1 DUF835 domain-containing protein [Thermococcus sp.]